MTQTNEYLSKNIIPAIMPQNFEGLRSEMKRFVSLVPLVQIDVMDGNLSPSKSWPYKDIVDGEFLKIVNQEVGFPSWEELDFEVDLMVADPVRMADQWIAAGAARVIVHYESASPEIISTVLGTIKDKGVESVLALGLETPIETAISFFEINKDNIDAIQFMGIKNIGFQGEAFDERVLANIASFREKYPEVITSVDGGVHEDSAVKLTEVGVSRFVVGSAFADNASPAEVIEKFNSLVNSQLN